MSSNRQGDISRRAFLVASSGLLLPRLAWTQTDSDLGFCWKLDDRGDTAHESVAGAQYPISSRTGHAIWVGEGAERALRLDGYSMWIEGVSAQFGLEAGPVTLSAWIALESYPVSAAAIIECGRPSASGFSLSIDKWGYLHFGVKEGAAWVECAASHALPRACWTHVAATLSASGFLTVYQDGVACGEVAGSGSALQVVGDGGLLIGKSSESPVVGKDFPTGVLNGLIKDVRIYEAQLPPAAVLHLFRDQKPLRAPDLQINGSWCVDDIHRPTYHALPPRAWTNEPHGLIYWQGQYHLFYQKNANGPYWGNINWGHMTSPDLYTWTEMPVALSPEHGVDAEGCWSGSVIEHEGRLAILYTGGDGHRASICLALSSDGIHFTKYAQNPVIAQPPQGANYPEFRDPFVWREGKVYYLIIGSAVKGVGGTALLYRSDDLMHWEFRKSLMVGDRETSGVFWEMPIFVRVGDMHVLIVCEVPGRSSYWVGSWKDEVFTPLSREPRRLELFNHLLSPTPHTTGDGEVLTMGIIPDQRSPNECRRAGWAHLYSLPRVLSVDREGRLQQQPYGRIAEWCDTPTRVENLMIEEGTAVPIAGMSGKCLRVRAVFERGTSRSISFIVRRSPDDRERTTVRYEWEIGRLVLDRSKSSLDPKVVRDVQEVTYFPREDATIDFEVFLDESVLEVFVDQRAAFATRIYPTLDESDALAVDCAGGKALVKAVSVSRVRKVH